KNNYYTCPKLGNTRISKTGIERRKSWVKFGDVVHDNVGDNLTVVSREVIAFEQPNAPGDSKTTEEKAESRKSSINSRKWSLGQILKQEKKVSSTDTSEDNPKILAFRRELEEIALKHLGKVSENTSTSTPSVNTGCESVNTGSFDPDDSPMPELEIFHKSETGIFDEASYDEEGVITDFNSLPTEIEVSPTPTLRIHNIYPKSQILGDLKSAVQTRSKVQHKSEAHALFSFIQKQQRNNHKDQQALFICLFSISEEPKKLSEALKMDINRNNRDERGVVVRNKDKIGAQWYTQKKVLTMMWFCSLQDGSYQRRGLCLKPSWLCCHDPIEGFIGGQSFVWIESCSRAWDKKDIMLFQRKAGIFISQDKYVAEILKKFDLVNVKTAITPMETKVALTKDEEAVDVDVTPKTSHLNAVKRIFKYLKGKPHLGLWYPRESPFDLESFSDSDYGGSNLDRKSTTVAANCCGQVLWVQNQLLDYGFNFMNTKIHIDNESTICIVKNPLYHSKTKHIEIRHYFIRDCYKKKLISVEKIYMDLNVAGLLTKPFDGPRFNYLVHAFLCFRLILAGIAWIYTTHVLPAIKYIVNEASIRDKLQLADASGITMLPNNEIFEGMGQMGYPTDASFTFWKSLFTPQLSNIATALICLSTGKVYNFSKLIFDGMVANLKSKTKFLMYPRFLQLILDIQTENKHPYLAVTLTKKIFGNMKRGFRGAPRPLLPAMLLVATTNPSAGQEHPAVAQSQPSSSTIPVPSISSPPVQSPTSIPAPIPASIPTPTPIPETDTEPMEHTFEEPSPAHQHFSPPQEHAQGQLTVDDLLHLVPQLVTRIDSLETDLKQTKLTMGSAIVKLVKKVKKLEGILKRRHVVLSDSEEAEPEAQGRKSQDDPLVSLVQGLVTPSKTTVNASGEEQVEDISPTTLEAAKTLSKVASQKPKSKDKGRRYKRRKESIGKKVATSLDFQEEVNTGSIKVSTVSEQVSTGSTKRSIPSPDKGQREGKAPMIIEEAPKKTKEQILHEEASLAEAIKLDTLQKEEEAKQIEANAELSKSMLGSDLQGEDFSKKMVDLNQGTWKLSQLKNLSFEEVKEEFDKLVKQVESFALINFESTKDSLKRFGEELQTKTSKRLKSNEEKDDEPTKKTRKRRKQMARKGLHTDLNKDDSEDSDEATIKSPSIATYKIIKQGEKGVYQIIREDGTDIVYINFGAMLKDISRDDLTELYRIVMNRYGMDGPEDELEKVLWEYLKNMFEEPLSTDPIWSLLGQQRIISWRYYDTCRVHCLNLESMDIYMLIERKYPLSAEICKAMLDKKLQGGKPDEDCYKMLKMMEKQAGIRK
ncbi:hypothetical protein Tco_0600488, partial [Tanacetum coccineum]